ncbi:MAG: cation transporter [Candidatus Heteroscillospira sp.]|jgi:copper chaperone CopZ
MKKTYKLVNLDCANCAAKMERGVAALPGVTRASVSFMMQKLVVEADESLFPMLEEQIRTVCKKVEPDCEVK